METHLPTPGDDLWTMSPWASWTVDLVFHHHRRGFTTRNAADFSAMDFSDRKSYCCVLRREWMGCWGLLGWLLIVSQWISQWIKISLLFVQFECYENEESMRRKMRTQNVDQQVLCTCLYQVSFCVFWPGQNGQNQRRAKIAWWNIHIP